MAEMEFEDLMKAKETGSGVDDELNLVSKHIVTSESQLQGYPDTEEEKKKKKKKEESEASDCELDGCICCCPGCDCDAMCETEWCEKCCDCCECSEGCCEACESCCGCFEVLFNCCD